MYKYRRGISDQDTVLLTHTTNEKLKINLSELMEREVVFDRDLGKEDWLEVSKKKVYMLLKENYLVNGSTALDHEFTLEEINIYLEEGK